MPLFPKRLSRTERVLLGLVALAALSGLYLSWASLQMTRQGHELAERVEKARQALATARSESDLPALQQERQALIQAVARSMPVRAEESKVTLKLWEWAAESKVELRDLEHSLGTLTLAESQFAALIYEVRAQGQPAALHRFMSLINSSQYTPQVEEMTLRPVEKGAGWDMTLRLKVAARPG